MVTVEQLADRLWTATAGTYRTVFAEARTSVIACNTFGTEAAARALRDAIAVVVPGKQIGTLVATIDHLDHSGCGAELAPHADVVAHRLTAEVMEGRKADRQLAATRIVDGAGEQLEIDGVRLELLYPGPTVGTGNLAVVFPDPCRPAIRITVGGLGESVIRLDESPIRAVSSSFTIFTTCWPGFSDSITSPPRARSFTAAVNDRTTLKFTSASSSASRISRIALFTSSSLSLPRERTSERTDCSLSERRSNTGPYRIGCA